MPERKTPLAERSWEEGKRTITVDAALTEVLRHIRPLPAQAVPLADARGLVTVDPIVAAHDVPPFCNSAMDGFAVRCADTAGASTEAPVYLRVVGAIPAGEEPVCGVEPGTAVRIMTGAVLPQGADAVVRIEETDEVSQGHGREGRIAILRAVKRLDNVRLAGEDIRKGAVALPAGTVLGAAHLGLLSSLGSTEVAVRPRPRVGILSTGDEVVAAGETPALGQIPDSNGVTLAAMVAEAGGLPVPLGIVHDDLRSLRDSLRAASAHHRLDLLVTSGGISVGDYDMVKVALRAEGEIALWHVRIKPGKPLAVGVIGGTPLLGLPGNPVAAAVGFLQFARPAIRCMLGDPNLALPRVLATVAAPIDNRGRRRHFVRVRLDADGAGGYRAVPMADQGSGILSSLALADGLLVVPEAITAVAPGTRLPVELMHDRLPMP